MGQRSEALRAAKVTGPGSDAADAELSELAQQHWEAAVDAVKSSQGENQTLTAGDLLGIRMPPLTAGDPTPRIAQPSVLPSELHSEGVSEGQSHHDHVASKHVWAQPTLRMLRRARARIAAARIDRSL